MPGLPPKNSSWYNFFLVNLLLKKKYIPTKLYKVPTFGKIPKDIRFTWTP
jgi:hypothetical protein